MLAHLKDSHSFTYQSPYGAKALQAEAIFCHPGRFIAGYQSPYGAKALQGMNVTPMQGATFTYQSPYGAKALQEIFLCQKGHDIVSVPLRGESLASLIILLLY